MCPIRVMRFLNKCNSIKNLTCLIEILHMYILGFEYGLLQGFWTYYGTYDKDES